MDHKSKLKLDSSPEEDLLAMEGRQLSLKTPLSDASLLSAASQLNSDYYDYYDEGENGLGGLSGKLSGLQKNKAGLNKMKAVQQRNGVSKLKVGASNNVGSFSGHSAGYGEEYCDNGVSLALLLTALLGVAVMFYVLYTKITKAGRRRKRSTDELNDLEEKMNPILTAMDNFEDIVYAGLEDFENKVDQIASGHEDDSWIGKLYKRLSENFANNDQISPEQMDGLEPPILDETWGLEELNNGLVQEMRMAIDKNDTEDRHQNLGFLSGTENIFENGLAKLFKGRECEVHFWGCLTKIVVETSHQFGNLTSITDAINKNLFKVVFHGGIGNFWKGLMSVPEARKVKHCMNKKDECLSQEILKKEANLSNPTNPRLIVNPEFVENLDNSDGSEQFDSEDTKLYKKTFSDNDIAL